MSLVTGGTVYVVTNNFVNSHRKRTDVDTTGPTG